MGGEATGSSGGNGASDGSRPNGPAHGPRCGWAGVIGLVVILLGFGVTVSGIVAYNDVWSDVHAAYHRTSGASPIEDLSTLVFGPFVSLIPFGVTLLGLIVVDGGLIALTVHLIARHPPITGHPWRIPITLGIGVAPLGINPFADSLHLPYDDLTPRVIHAVSVSLAVVALIVVIGWLIRIGLDRRRRRRAECVQRPSSGSESARRFPVNGGRSGPI